MQIFVSDIMVADGRARIMEEAGEVMVVVGDMAVMEVGEDVDTTGRTMAVV